MFSEFDENLLHEYLLSSCFLQTQTIKLKRVLIKIRKIFTLNKPSSMKNSCITVMVKES